MANLGVVSEALARGRLPVTALCELAVNVARKASQNSAFAAYFRPHVTCARYTCKLCRYLAKAP